MSCDLTSILRMEKCVYGNAKRSDLSQKMLSNVIGSVMVWGGISNRGTSEIVVVNGALKDSKILRGNSRFCSAKVMQESWIKRMLPRTLQVTHKSYRTILTFWIGLQDRQICQQLSTFGTFLVVVKDIDLTSTK